MSSENTHFGTRERLIEAGGEVFADKGFREATVRDICQRAGANLASVNYYFRDKETLYAEVFEHARQYEHEHYPLEVFQATGGAEERLSLYIRQFCLRLFDPGRPNWHVKLMSREMIEPTVELDTIVEKAIRPKFLLLCVIVSDFIGLPADHDATVMCAASIIGQCLHHHHCKEVTRRLYAGCEAHPGFIDEITSHVTWFSLSALRGIREQIRTGGAASVPYGEVGGASCAGGGAPGEDAALGIARVAPIDSASDGSPEAGGAS
jgi:TetR/AcrR family transcriptional regulator, regulator of cefoperazone and chloramphenicol sensitivity